MPDHHELELQAHKAIAKAAQTLAERLTAAVKTHQVEATAAWSDYAEQLEQGRAEMATHARETVFQRGEDAGIVCTTPGGEAA